MGMVYFNRIFDPAAGSSPECIFFIDSNETDGTTYFLYNTDNLWSAEVTERESEFDLGFDLHVRVYKGGELGVSFIIYADYSLGVVEDPMNLNVLGTHFGLNYIGVGVYEMSEGEVLMCSQANTNYGGTD